MTFRSGYTRTAVAAILLAAAGFQTTTALAAACLQVPSPSYPTISAAAASFKGQTLSADQCISVAAGTYNEQVDVEGVNPAGFRLLLESTGPIGGAVVQPPASSTAAFVLASASVTVQGFAIAPASSLSYGILISSAAAGVSQDSLADSAGHISVAGIMIEAAGGAAIDDASVSLNSAVAYALYAGSSSNDAITDSVLSNSGGGDGAYFSGGGHETIDASTFSTVDAAHGALYLLNNANTTITQSFMVDAGPGACAGGSGNAEGLALDGSGGAVVSLSTITTNGNNEAALVLIDGADGDQFSADYVSDAFEADAVFIDAASHGNSIAHSALAANASFACQTAVLEIKGSSNSVDDTLVTDAGTNELGVSNGIFLQPGASFNTVTHSTVNANGQFYGVLFLDGDNSDNQFSNDAFIGNAYEARTGQSYVLWLATSDYHNRQYAPDTANSFTNISVSQSGTSDPAVGISGAIDSSFTGMRIVNDTPHGHGIDVINSTATILSDVWLSNDSGPGIVVSQFTSGLTLSSDTVTNAEIGLQFADTSPMSVAVTTLTFQSLKAGATGVQFLGGAWDSTFTYVAFADNPGNREANVDASEIGPGNTLTFLDSTGPLGGANGPIYKDDPNGVVSFPSSTPPATPAGLAGAGSGIASIAWTWTADSSATVTGYNFYFSTGGSVALSAAATSFTQTGLAANTGYGAQIQAVDFSLTSGLSATVTAYTTASVPNAPSVTAVASTTLTASFSSGNGAGTPYEARLSTAADFSGAVSTSALSATASAVFSSLSAATTYYLAVRAQGHNGAFTAFSPEVSTTTLAYLGSVAAAPAGLAGAAVGTSSITWTWDPVAGATSYKLTLNANAPLSVVGTTTYTDSTLSPNASETAQVASVNAAGASGLSAPVTSYTLAAPPVNLRPTVVNASSITFTWSANANPGGTNYRIGYAPSLGGADTTAAAGTAPPFTVTGLSGGTTYVFTLSAINGDGLAAVGASTDAVTTGLASAASSIGPAGGSIVFRPPTGAITLNIPPGAFSSPVTVTLEAPQGELPPDNISGIRAQGTGIGVQILISPAAEPDLGVPITVTYAPASLNGTDPHTLFIARWDSAEAVWVPLPSNVNTSNDTVSAVTGHLSLFQLMYNTAATSLSGATVFPNPYRPAKGDSTITFANLPAFAALKIYTILGEKVRTLSADASGLASWDSRNSNGNACASGVYFVLAGSGGSKTTFKVAIQR